MKIVDERNGSYKHLVQGVLIYPSLEQDEPILPVACGYIKVYVEHVSDGSNLDYPEKAVVQWNINLRDMTVDRFDSFMSVLAYARKLADETLLTHPELPLPKAE